MVAFDPPAASGLMPVNQDSVDSHRPLASRDDILKTGGIRGSVTADPDVLIDTDPL